MFVIMASVAITTFYSLGLLTNMNVYIIFNAIDAIEGKGTITITTQYLEDEKKHMISVQATGRGIAAHLNELIFAPFFTAKKVLQRPGLGLPTAPGIAREHQGDTKVSSREGHGANFFVFLSKL